ncbi:MAG: 2-polyprenyl-6-methoxyphenol hydroxylase-like oxidoreductase [Patescibacteria group bacterium]|nr:2-polyprenyl-6-methoxyphenol hydroxylase-like oxidoreductase [Patescibacteria group bacterium]
MDSKRKILIVGGGIAGVALADFLDSSKFEVTIAERAPEWRTIGYAIGVWVNGLRILKKFDLPESFWDKFEPVDSGAVIDLSGSPISIITKEMIGKDTLAGKIERDLLHKALIGKLPKEVAVRFGVTCIDFKQKPGGVAVTFSDETEETFDLVVGADGMRSQVRESIFGNYLKSYGWHVILSWAPRSFKLDSDYYILNAPGQVVLAIPYGDRVSIGFSIPKRGEASAEDIFKSFEKIGSRVTDVLSAFDRNHLFHDELVHVKMKRWHLGRVVLIGDARHGMSPISGFGTSLALGDAYELAACLGEFHSPDDALAVFAKRRQKSTKYIFLFSRLMESFFTLESKWLVALRDLLFRTGATKLAARVLRKALDS